MGQLLDLRGQLAREIAQLADHQTGHALHLRRLGADFVSRLMGPSGDVVDHAGQSAGGVAQAGFETRQRVVGICHNVVEVLGVGLEPRQQRIGITIDDKSCLVKGGALVFDSGYQAANAFLVAAEGPFDGRDFLVDDFLQHGGTLHRVLDPADQQVDFRAHRLCNGGKALGGNVLRPDEPHGGLHQDLGNLAQLRGAPQEVSQNPDETDGQHQQGERRHRIGHAFRRGRTLAAEQRAGENEEPTGDPGQRQGKCAIVGREGRLPAQARQHHRGAGIILVGRPSTDRCGVEAAPGRFTPLDFGLGGALILTPGLGRIACHVYFPASTHNVPRRFSRRFAVIP